MIPPNACNTITPFCVIALFLLSLSHKTLSLGICTTSYCPTGDAVSTSELDAYAVHFPFKLSGSNTSARCSYPGFMLTCDDQSLQPILTLRAGGAFTVQEIDYVNQVILVSDPENCLPKRILKLNLTGTPYSGSESRNHTFLNCTNGNSSSSSVFMAAPVPCLSEGNYTVYITYLDSAVETMTGSGECRVIKSVWSPVLWPLYDDGSGPDLDRAGMALGWGKPDCGDCVRGGGSCGLIGGSGLEIGCSVSNSTRGASKIVKYGLILGMGIPAFIFMVGLTFYFSGKLRIYNQRRRQMANTEFSPSVFPQPAILMVGLDGHTIESYPKTQLGESGRLPNPSNAICPICLSDYEAKETIRTIPECNHYFHAHCIDEWLRLKGTCPLCRNSPGK